MVLTKLMWRNIFQPLIFCLLISSGALANEYDFDHKVHYKQQKLGEHKFFLEVIAKNNTSFDKLSVFLLRRAYKLCGSYRFKLEILKGIEQYDDRKISSSYIQPNLTANVECPSK